VHPTLKSTLALFAAAVALFLLSPSGQDSGYWQSGPSWLGNIAWYSFMVCVLLLVVSGIYVAVARIRHHDQPAAH